MPKPCTMLMMSSPLHKLLVLCPNPWAQNYSIHDPELSSLGVEQCKELRQNLSQKFADKTDAIIIVSPMRRTIQTALLSLDWLIKNGVPIQADARWQENSAKPCDTGSSIAELSVEFPGVDFSFVDPIYPDKTSPAGAQYSYTREAILKRARSSINSIYERKERLVFVVSHSGFLRLGVTGHWFFNGDYRAFELDKGDEPGSNPELRQLQSTISGGLGKSWTDPVVIGSGLPILENPTVDIQSS
ncbi:phosphoglycerate mutase [Colletotrichum camelliae]|nr:phosphoglycerate mutase [Colletotrichum camelliae]